MHLKNPKPKQLILIIIAVMCFVLFSHLNTVDLRGEEPRRAVVSMEMDISGQYIVPEIHGWPYYNKPPLFNWVQVCFFNAFNSYDPWVARLPSLVAFIMTATTLYFLVRKYLTENTAVFSAFFFLTAGDILFFGSLVSGEIDLFFVLITFLQMASIFHFSGQRKYVPLFLFSYALTAMGVLTKGTPSMAFQLLTLTSWFIYSRTFKHLFTWKHLLGLVLFGMITGGYFYSYSRHQEVIPFLVNLLKESSQRSVLESNFGPTLLNAITFPANLVRFLLPWSVFSLYLLSKDIWLKIKENKLVAFSAIFFIVNIPLYWITADTKGRYIYPFFPFILILLTWFWQQRKDSWSFTTKMVNIIFTVIVCLAAVVTIIIPWVDTFSEVPDHFIKSSILGIASLAIAWLFFRDLPNRIYYVALSLIILRAGMNLFYLPVLSKETSASVNKHHVETILTITGEKGFSLSGPPVRSETKVDFGPIGALKANITMHPGISYIIPYFYTRETQKILHYDTIMQSGRYYLLYTRDTDLSSADTLYSFTEPWTRQKIALIRSD